MEKNLHKGHILGRLATAGRAEPSAGRDQLSGNLSDNRTTAIKGRSIVNRLVRTPGALISYIVADVYDTTEHGPYPKWVDGAADKIASWKGLYSVRVEQE